jgi:AhpD family alkylhydroperoxidase
MSIKLTGGRSCGCASKAVELTSGDLRHVTNVTEGEAIHPDRVAEVSYGKVAPGAYRVLGLEHYIYESGLEESLLHLIKLRASQINGGVYSIDLHWKDLKSIGEQDYRLYELNAWEESPFYTDRERAA